MALPDTFHSIAETTFQQVLDVSGRTVNIVLANGDRREGVRVSWREPSRFSRAVYGMSIDGKAYGCRLFTKDAEGVEKTAKIESNGETFQVIDEPDHGDLGITTDLTLGKV